MTLLKPHLVVRPNYPKTLSINQLIYWLSQEAVIECQLWAKHCISNKKPSVLQSAKCNSNLITHLCSFII